MDTVVCGRSFGTACGGTPLGPHDQEKCMLVPGTFALTLLLSALTAIGPFTIDLA